MKQIILNGPVTITNDVAPYLGSRLKDVYYRGVAIVGKNGEHVVFVFDMETQCCEWPIYEELAYGEQLPIKANCDVIITFDDFDVSVIPGLEDLESGDSKTIRVTAQGASAPMYLAYAVNIQNGYYSHYIYIKGNEWEWEGYL